MERRTRSLFELERSRASEALRDCAVAVRKACAVVVWDERHLPRSKPTPTFWAIRSPNISRARPESRCDRSASMIPARGSRGGVLDDCQVLIWWGHVRNGEIAPEVGQSIVEKIKAGRLSLIALHSAHWSTPFVEAMYERDATRCRQAASRG